LTKSPLIAIILVLIGLSLLLVGTIRHVQTRFLMDQQGPIAPLEVRYVEIDRSTYERRYRINLKSSGGSLMFTVMDYYNFHAFMENGDFEIDPEMTVLYEQETVFDCSIAAYEQSFFVWVNLNNYTVQNLSTIYQLELASIVPRTLPYFGLFLLIITPISLVFRKFEAKTPSHQKGTGRAVIGGVAALLLLGFADGIALKEGILFSNALVFITSVVIWVLLTLPIFMLFERDVKTEASSSLVIWRDFFGVIHIDDVGEMFQGIAIFLIAGFLWFIPFAVIWLLL